MKNIKIRGHHLLCMLAYVGKGYTKAFSQNFDTLIQAINNGTSVQIVDGIDDICVALHNGQDNGDYTGACHCLQESAAKRDTAALRDVGTAMEIPLTQGREIHLTKEKTAKLRQLFAEGTQGPLRPACQGCDWSDTCTDIATSGFKGAKLFP